ncbi:MAG: response regulator [Anaerolineae bacterium]|nr:response regulator [Anaerolineae bacterium]
MARILVVEDSSDMRQLLRDLLSALGHEVVEAADGLEGVNAALHLHPDLIILDLMMPIVHGSSFLQLKQDTPGIENIPVLIVSAHSEVDQIARRWGIKSWLAKPVRISELDHSIGQILGSLP